VAELSLSRDLEPRSGATIIDAAGGGAGNTGRLREAIGGVPPSWAVPFLWAAGTSLSAAAGTSLSAAAVHSHLWWWHSHLRRRVHSPSAAVVTFPSAAVVTSHLRRWQHFHLRLRRTSHSCDNPICGVAPAEEEAL